MENKKVKNATLCEYDGIRFKSILEMDSYIVLKEEGFNPEYEKKTFHIWEGKKFLVPCYEQFKDRKLHKKVWGLNSYKPLDVKYTPDFTFFICTSSGAMRLIIIECKGKENDVYPYKKKLFRTYLETNHPDSIFFEIHSKKQLCSAVEVIKQLKNGN